MQLPWRMKFGVFMAPFHPLGDNPGLALEWRMTTRRIFQSYFGRGYKAVDFFLSREEGRGQYLLARD